MPSVRVLASAYLMALVTAVSSLGEDPPAKQPRFTCEFRKKDDSFKIVTPKPGEEVFNIKSASGIGNAVITCREGKWPATITVLFVGMTNLEQLNIEGNGVRLPGRLVRGGNQSFFDFNEKGEALPDSTNSAYHLAIESKKGEGMLVTLRLPKGAQATKTWKFDWIDAFRR